MYLRFVQKRRSYRAIFLLCLVFFFLLLIISNEKKSLTPVSVVRFLALVFSTLVKTASAIQKVPALFQNDTRHFRHKWIFFYHRTTI